MLRLPIFDGFSSSLSGVGVFVALLASVSLPFARAAAGALKIKKAMIVEISLVTHFPLNIITAIPSKLMFRERIDTAG
jgi:hypothetical protein